MAVDLHPYQRTLLRAIWDGVAHPEFNNDQPVWPVWDHVARRLEREHPDVDDALDVWRSLPAQAVSIDRHIGIPYSLVWVAGTAGTMPRYDSEVGLTIAGLKALGKTLTSAQVYADSFAAVIGAMARADDSLESSATTPARNKVPLAKFTDALRARTTEAILVIPDPVTVMLLQHEAAQVDLVDQFGDSPPSIELGGRRLRSFRKVRTAKDYLDVIDAHATRRAGSAHTTSLTLIQTFDYLGYVLQEHKEWTTRRLTLAPDLESAAAISRDVNTEDEYRSALSGLSTVIDQIQVREIPGDAPEVRKDPTRAAGSINRLEYWMNTYVAPDANQDQINEVILSLRAVKKLRNAVQHPSPANRATAVEARGRFGISEFSVDYAAMWQRVSEGVAAALDLLRVEVQAAQRSVVEQA